MDHGQPMFRPPDDQQKRMREEELRYRDRPGREREWERDRPHYNYGTYRDDAAMREMERQRSGQHPPGGGSSSDRRGL